MVNKKKDQIVYAFIDSQNLYKGVEKLGWKLNFARFRVYLSDKYKVEEAFLFIGYRPGNEWLYSQLQRSGYVLVFKPTLEIKKRKEMKIKGNVDGELILHAMIEYDNYEKAIVVAGDGDYHCLVEYLVAKDKFLKLLVPNRKGFSALLRKFMDYVEFVDILKKKVAYKQKAKKERH